MAWLCYLIFLPCVGAWNALGAGAGRLLHSPQPQRHLNRALALLLLIAAWAALLL